MIGDEGAKSIAEALKFNSTLLEFELSDSNNMEDDIFLTLISELLEKNDFRKRMNYRRFICAFSDFHFVSARLRFDKMILRYVFYPIMGVLPDDEDQ
jgi:hypothetical protein